MRVENRRTAQSHAFLLRYGQSGVHTLANDFAFELSHGAQNVKLQLASRVFPVLAPLQPVTLKRTNP